MLQLLTEYLIRARSVTIPHIGSLHLQHRPASWHPVDQLLQAPGYTVSLEENQQPSQSQLDFLASGGSSSDLDRFGMLVKKQAEAGSFSWPGVGSLRLEAGSIALDPAVPELTPALRAERVIREDARHTIRVGEQEVASNFYEERVVVDERSQDKIWLAWTLVALATLFIICILYMGGFSPQASGLRGPLPNLLP